MMVLVTRQLMVAIDLVLPMEVNGYLQQKLIQVWNNIRASKLIFIFWVNYPFKASDSYNIDNICCGP